MASSRPDFSDLQFASFLVYPARRGRPLTDVEQRAKSLLLGIKQLRVNPRFAPPDLVEWAVWQLLEALPNTALDGFFRDRTCALIAAPGSSLTLKHSVSAPLGLCKALMTAGLAARMLPRVIRTGAVPNAAYADPGERPTPQVHYDTMAVPEVVLHPPASIIIVDDIITKGATLMGAAARVREAYPAAIIRVFALARTAAIDSPDGSRAPTVGRISVVHGDAHRDP